LSEIVEAEKKPGLDASATFQRFERIDAFWRTTALDDQTAGVRLRGQERSFADFSKVSRP